MIINLLNLNLVATQWYQSFETAKAAINVIETMRMIQKGQLLYAGKDIYAQNKVINKILN